MCRMAEKSLRTNSRARMDIMALGCLTIFALQCIQNLQGKGNVLPATIDTSLLVVVQLGFWLFVIGTILVSLLLRRMRPADLFGFDRLSFAKVFLWGAGLLIAALPLIFASSAVVSSLMHVNSQKDSQPIMQLFERVSEPTRKIPIILLAVVIAPLAEEFFFRGFLYGVLKRYAGALPALVFTGVAFAADSPSCPFLVAPVFIGLRVDARLRIVRLAACADGHARALQRYYA